MPKTILHIIILLISTAMFGQLAPKPFMFNFDNTTNKLDPNTKTKLKVQVDSTLIVLKIHNIKYNVVNVAYYDTISSTSSENIVEKYNEIKKYLISLGVKRNKIIYKENDFLKSPSLLHIGKGWKIQFLL